MPFGFAACAIEVWVSNTELFGDTFFNAPWPVVRVHQIVKMLKLGIAPQFCINIMVKLCGELVVNTLVGAFLDHIINGFNIDESCAGASFESFQDMLLGKDPACRLGRVVMVFCESCHQTVWA